MKEAVSLYDWELQTGREELRSRAAQVSITLAATLSDAGQQEEALHELDAAIAVLEDHVRRGRGDLEQYLALGQMNRGLVALRMRNLVDAEHNLDEAVDCFDRLFRRGREDVRGWLGHALVIRAEVRFRSGNTGESAVDRKVGFEHLDALALMHVPIARLVYIRKEFDTAAYLPNAEFAQRLNGVIRETLAQYTEGTLRERFAHEMRTGLRRIATVRSKLIAVGLDDPLVQNLEKQLEG